MKLHIQANLKAHLLEGLGPHAHAETAQARGDAAFERLGRI